VKHFVFDWAGFGHINAKETRIHPTQKPVRLYKWLLHNYAKPDFKIIDTHAGSCSSVIAFLDFGCDWIAFEIDKDYYEAANKRIENHKMQLKLF
jgi:site-specific DNA-methyltransferase (adenine-specific)